MALAREQHETWAPITNRGCVEGSGIARDRWPDLPPLGWRENGQSYSCNYCGSMSTEEMLECLEAIPRPRFDLADPPKQKVYIARYPHAGNCPTEENAHCSCDVKRGGGPIKFYARHLFDGGRSQEEAMAIWNRVQAAGREDFAEMMKRMGARAI